MPEYHSLFDHGDRVRVVALDTLSEFKANWKWHHPVEEEQLQFTGKLLYVEDRYYYHGGGVLYSLFAFDFSGKKNPIPGMWHEAVIEEEPPSWKFVRADGVIEAISGVRNGQPVVIVRGKTTPVEYLVTRYEQADQMAKNMAIVFSKRDVHMVASKYGFELDFPPEPR